mgnify:CR=1 FL=1
MIAVVVVVIDEDTDLLLQIAWQVVVFQENAVLHGLVPAFVVRAYAAPLGPPMSTQTRPKAVKFRFGGLVRLTQ